jgi:hypothetical protein
MKNASKSRTSASTAAKAIIVMNQTVKTIAMMTMHWKVIQIIIIM